ncbi:MAG: alpha/beta hydrolase, partial [Chloroflexi bacterium]|nr:alpha/beta hydrolase [Chloroflexota bacterium]
MIVDMPMWLLQRPTIPKRIALTAFAALPLLLLSLLWPSLPRADGNWTSVRTADGLLGDTVQALAATPSGGMLIGTSRGLNYWDGQQLRMYSAGNGLVRGAITALAEAEGAVWAGSWGGGLAVLSGDAWQRLADEGSAALGDWISDLAPAPDGIWVATYGRGLALLQQGRRTVYRRGDSALPSDWLTRLLPDGCGGLWIGTERAGLAHLDAQGRFTTFDLPGRVNAEVTALAQVGDTLWVGTPRGLHILEPTKGIWRTPAGIERVGAVTALLPVNDGVWIGALSGLFFWQGDQLWQDRVEGLPRTAVSALALDRQGRLWVGTYGQGVAVQGPLALRAPARLPVVLVHGWRGPNSDRLEDSEFWFLARWLREDGFLPVYATGIRPEQTLHQNARRLREVIRQAKAKSGTDQVYLVGFSMGGLNVRAYLESDLYAGDVARAFILGTPHRGEHLWLTLLLWERLAWSQEPSAVELTPLHADLFNQTHAHRLDVPYVLIAGDARQEELPDLFRELPPGDGLVSAWSALGPPTYPGDKAWHSGVVRAVTEDVHAWSQEIIALALPSLLFPRTTYEAHIRPYLFGVGDMPGMGRSADLSAPVPKRDPRSALRTGNIDPGETVFLPPIPLEAEQGARFYLRWKGPAPEMHLRDPSGRLITPDDLPDEAEYLALDFADFAAYILTDTLPGPWTVELKVAKDAEEAARFVVYAEQRAPEGSALEGLTLASDRTWYRPGEAVTLTATIEGVQGVSWERVWADLYRLDGTDTAGAEVIKTIELAPAAKGGVWVGRFMAPFEGGYYALLGRAV